MSPISIDKRIIYGGYGYGNGNGLSTGARVGIGIAAGVCFVIAILLFTRVARRRRAQQNAAQLYSQQSLPTSQPQTSYPPMQSYNSGYNPNNTATGVGANSSYYGQTYAPSTGAPPIKAPQQAYQPSMAGQYGGYNADPTNTQSQAQTDGHDYEYQQAQENARLEALEQNGNENGGNEGLGGALPPPAYAPAGGQQQSGPKHYPVPSGPPPRPVDPTNLP